MRTAVPAMLLLGCVTTSDNVTAPASSLAIVGASVRGAETDTDGLADLIVDEKATRNNWLVRVEDFSPGLCSVEEGNLAAGEHPVLRFTVTTPNVGDADVFIGSPLQHMDPNGDGSFADRDDMFEFARCHDHFHFRNYATYRLIGPDGTEWRAAKRGFCMLDTDPYNTGTGDGTWTYRSCGTASRDGFQGISTGWSDTYAFFLSGQFFVLDGSDGQPAIPPGDYVIEIHVNPPYAPDESGTCPLATDESSGLCHQFAERDYANNIGRVAITIPSHPGRSGIGPLKNDNTKITRAKEIDHADY
jgi:hypothetical protein